MDTQTNRRRRSAPLLWASGGLAAVVLVLGATGTLSTWSQAIITNDNNTVGSAKAVALSESTSGGGTCVDTATTSTNTATCTSVNKYGGASTTNTADSSPLSPGGSRTITVTLKNTGPGDATSLNLAAGSCTQVSNADGTSAKTTSGNLCDVATVSVQCTAPSTLTTATTPVALSSFTGASIGALASGASTDCTFTVALPSSAPASVSDQLAKQTLTWTLNG